VLSWPVRPNGWTGIMMLILRSRRLSCERRSLEFDDGSSLKATNVGRFSDSRWHPWPRAEKTESRGR
jgi:hypothetical protein